MKYAFAALRAGGGLLICCIILTGLAYPVLVTGLVQLLFPHAANGSLIVKDGAVYGSELLGQEFSDPKYFWGRPSATLPPYNASASAASNLSPANHALHARVGERIAALQKADPDNENKIPVDLITSSASGLDPHISRAAAEYQVARVARLRRMEVGDVRRLVHEYTENPLLGQLPYVHIVRLNMALDEASKARAIK